MPNHTTKLNLYEMDTFDLDTVLNENWEKIDENVINKNGTVALVAEQIGVDPTSAQGLATKNYVDTNLVLKADLNGNTVEKFNVADAVQSTEAINKGQLDSATSTINTTITSLDTEITAELETKADTTYVDSFRVVTPVAQLLLDGANLSTTGTEITLSFLPNDGGTYEIFLSGMSNTPASSGAQGDLIVKSDFMPTYGSYLARCISRGDIAFGGGSVSFFTNNRKITAFTSSPGTTSFYFLWCYGYRKVG